MAENNTSPVPAKANERTYTNKDEIAPDSGAYNAVELDIVTADDTPSQGSGVSIGDGLVLISSHIFIDNENDQAASISAKLREGVKNEGGYDSRIGDSDRHNIGNYDPTDRVVGESDMAVLDTGINNAPTAKMIVFQDANDAVGPVRSFGYPGIADSKDTVHKIDGKTLEGETLVITEGEITANSTEKSINSEVLRTNPDTPGQAGMGAVGGMSGGGVWIEYAPISANIRLDEVEHDPNAPGEMLIGTITLGSTSGPWKDDRSHISFDATEKGAAFTPLNEQTYGALGELAYAHSRELQIEEEFKAQKEQFRAETRAEINAERAAVKAEREIAKQVEKDGGPEYNKSDYPMPDRYSNRAADRELSQQIENDPDLNDRVAERFGENTMIADIGANDGTSSTFNGSDFRETLHANANVNITSDLSHGRDGVDFRALKHGVDIEIGANSAGASVVSVTKTYDKTDGSGTATAKDQYTDAEVILGTGSNDTYTIKSFADIEEINGRDPATGDDRDTLRLSEDIGPVSWEFKRNDDGSYDRTQGVVRYQGQQVEFRNLENVETRDGDAVNGHVQGPAPDALRQGLRDMELEEKMDNIRHLNSPNDASYENEIDYGFG